MGAHLLLQILPQSGDAKAKVLIQGAVERRANGEPLTAGSKRNDEYNGTEVPRGQSEPPALQFTGTSNPTNTGGAPLGTTPSGANMNVPNTVVQGLLGRLPPGGLATGTTVVALLDASNKLYADTRRNQIDMRFAKIFRFGARRVDVGVDLQNLLNTNYPTAYETQYSYTAANGGTWNNPTTILGPRFMRFNFTLNY
jgi:hypothetical protein